MTHVASSLGGSFRVYKSLGAQRRELVPARVASVLVSRSFNETE
jgi:hypothetical protein